MRVEELWEQTPAKEESIEVLLSTDGRVDRVRKRSGGERNTYLPLFHCFHPNISQLLNEGLTDNSTSVEGKDREVI